MGFWEIYGVAYISIGLVVGWESGGLARRDIKGKKMHWFRRVTLILIMWEIGLIFWPVIAGLSLGMYIVKRRRAKAIKEQFDE